VSIALLAVAGVVVIATLGVISMVGKPRQPYTGLDAVAITIMNTAVIVLMVLAAVKLGV
jgi:hypothetical protein